MSKLSRNIYWMIKLIQSFHKYLVSTYYLPGTILARHRGEGQWSLKIRFWPSKNLHFGEGESLSSLDLHSIWVRKDYFIAMMNIQLQVLFWSQRYNWGMAKGIFFPFYHVWIILNKAVLTLQLPIQESHIAPPEYFCRFYSIFGSLWLLKYPKLMWITHWNLKW